jgi:hypothetical protein
MVAVCSIVDDKIKVVKSKPCLAYIPAPFYTTSQMANVAEHSGQSVSPIPIGHLTIARF